ARSLLTRANRMALVRPAVPCVRRTLPLVGHVESERPPKQRGAVHLRSLRLAICRCQGALVEHDLNGLHGCGVWSTTNSTTTAGGTRRVLSGSTAQWGSDLFHDEHSLGRPRDVQAATEWGVPVAEFDDLTVPGGGSVCA